MMSAIKQCLFQKCSVTLTIVFHLHLTHSNVFISKLNQSSLSIQNAYNTLTKVRSLDLHLREYTPLVYFSHVVLELVQFEWRLFRSSGRPWQAKVNFLIGSCIKVANTTLVSKKMCVCQKYCIFYSSVLFFQGYRSHVGLALSVNMKKAKWQLILAPLIYNVSSYTNVLIRKWIVLFFFPNRTGSSLD